jgi:hypothetical protein
MQEFMRARGMIGVMRKRPAVFGCSGIAERFERCPIFSRIGVD